MQEASLIENKILRSKLALVTGASRGIGRGIALRLAERGAAIAVNYHQDKAAAHETLLGIQERGTDGFLIQADVSRPEQMAHMAVQVRERFGALDIFVHNALGDLLSFMSPPLQVALAQRDAAYQCQARAFLVGVREVTPFLRECARILAISYGPGSHLGGFLPYFAMGSNKAALEAMCRYFAVALAPRGTTVNAVCAGITDDSIVNRLPTEVHEAMLARLREGWTPQGRPGTRADIGGAVATLCADDAG